MSNIYSAEQFENFTKDDYLFVSAIHIDTRDDWCENMNKIFKCINVKEVSITFLCDAESLSSIPFDNFAIFQKLNSLQMCYITQLDSWWIELDFPSVCYDGKNMLITSSDINSHNALITI